MNYGFRLKDQLPVCLLLMCMVFWAGVRFSVINGYPAPVHSAAFEYESLPTREFQFELDVNLATCSQLTLLPGIGERLAGRIIEFRDQFGGIRDLERLQEIEGIGPRKMEVIRKYLRTSQQSSSQFNRSGV